MNIDNKVSLTRLAKVAPPPKFRGELGKLKEYLAKLRIYIGHNPDSFDIKANKVMFAISYLEGPVFNFMLIYLEDYNDYDTKD